MTAIIETELLKDLPSGVSTKEPRGHNKMIFSGQTST